MWPQRFSKIGTYDEEWLRTRFPGVAKDMDPTFFNTAAPDQWLERYFAGDEAFTIENMHPERARIEGKLPGLATRAFINQKTAAGEAFKEIKTRLDTVQLFPNALRGVLSYRGMVEVGEDDAADVLQLVVAGEDPAIPRDVDHYRRVLAERLDKRKGALASLRDQDLMPAGEGWAPRVEKSDIETMIQGEGLLRRNLKRKQDDAREEARARLVAQGLDPAEFGMDDWPEDEESPSIDDPDAFFAFVDRQMARAEEAKAELEAKKAESEQRAREQLAAIGVDYDEACADALKEAGGPPKFSADDEIAKLRGVLQIARDGGAPLEDIEAQVEHPGYAKMMREMEQRMKDAYKKFAHHFPAAAALDGDEAQRLRVLATAARDGGVSLAGRDFTGADLSGLDLTDMDLRGCFLEGADFSGADLSGADLSEAVLARAKLTDAKLVGAKLVGANLGDAKLRGADLSGADLERAVLGKSDLDGACLRGARLNHADLLETRFGAADLREIVGQDLLFLKVDLTKTWLAGADLARARFIEATLTGLDLSGVTLSGAQLITCNADRVILRRAKLGNAVFAHGSSLAFADLTGATMPSANLRGTPMTEAKLAGACLDGADLSGCDLRKADLYRAVARGAMFVKSDLGGARMVGMNLMNALLAKATLRGADLTGTNLFRADLARIATDGETKLDDALLTQARIIVRRSHAAG